MSQEVATPNAEVATKFESMESHLQEMKDSKARSIAAVPVGSQMIQGDVRAVRCPADFIEKNRDRLEQDTKFSGQCAPGTTEGSKHILVTPDSLESHQARVALGITEQYTPVPALDLIEPYSIVGGNELDGPIVLFKGDVTLYHPSHGNLTGFKAGDVFAFPGQQVYAEEVRRTRD